MGQDLHFDGWTLRRPSGELIRGALRVRLQGQPLQVLEVLLAQPGELVSREQLIARLWPNGVVVDFDTALNSAVRRLRTALDDHAESPRYIETIPRRGYRFIGQLDAVPLAAAVEHVVPVPLVAAASRERPAPGLRLGIAAVVVVVVAVLATTWQSSPSRQVVSATAPAKPNGAVSAATRELYQRGRYFLERRDTDDTARALALFEQALRIDPAYAAAWAGIAGVRWLDTVEGRLGREQGLMLTREAAENALALDPANAEAMLRLANYHRQTGDATTAAVLTRRASELAPDDPLVLAFQAGEAASAGRFDAAIALQRRAVQQGPLALPARHNLAVWLFVAGRFDEARDEFAKIAAINPPGKSPHVLIGQALLLQGDHRGALEYAETLSPGLARTQLEALAHAALGQRAAADAALAQLEQQVPDRMAYLVAEVHAYRGDADAAFAWLQRSARAGAGNCEPDECWPRDWVPVLPLLKPLQSDPRWLETRTMLVSAGPPNADQAGRRSSSHQ